MSGWTTEFKVGLLGLAAVGFTVLFVLLTDDRPDGALNGYILYADFPSAKGVQDHTQVDIAGVQVGSVVKVELVDNQARLHLEMVEQVKLPRDSTAELASDGVLGDKVVILHPGEEAALLGDGDVIASKPPMLDIDALSARGDQISKDVEAITAALRELLEDPSFKQNVSGSLGNIEQLSAELESMAAANRAEIDAIARNLRDVSENLKQILDASGQKVDQELGQVEETLDKLDRTAAQLEEIATRVNAGEGTVGYLLNDDTPAKKVEQTLDEVNAALGEVNGVLGSLNNLGTEVYYDGAIYFGSAGDFGPNPVHGQARNAIGLNIMPREDYWYIVEVVDHPLGTFEATEYRYPDLGAAYTQYLRRDRFRFSFQFARRYGPVAFRLGIKDSAGGVGADAFLWKDRVRFSADLYDFTYGSWPVLDGTPNLNVGLKVEPYPHLFVQAGLHNVLLGARHGYYTGYVGGGIRFNDDDVRWILAALPSVP
ncbi:MAG: MCE family protein [Alphaproteobacteria bacterium]|nr:MCE family protein [Alphaproteobacteria bacterium]